jgi:hypothetical protein
VTITVTDRKVGPGYQAMTDMVIVTRIDFREERKDICRETGHIMQKGHVYLEERKWIKLRWREDEQK